MRRSSLLLISSAALALGACQFKKNSDEEKISPDEIKQVIQQQGAQEEENAAAVLTNDNVSVKFVPEVQPKQYRLEIRWPTTVPRVSLSINETLLGDFSKGIFERSVIHGSSLSIRMDARNSKGYIVSTVLMTVQAPQDLLINEVIHMQKDESWSYNRIFIAQGMPIYTNGYNLEMKASEISSKDGRILTFPERLGTANQRELTNGHILIQAKKLTGTLDVRLYGQHGLNGANGVDKVTANMPKEGAAGASGQQGTKRMTELGPCEGLGGGVRIPPSRHRPACGARWICDRQATDGANGGRGADGLSGDNGTNGGNTGSITFAVEDYSQARVDIFMSAGLPGLGGQGQPGYAGGPGGKGGAALYEGSELICNAGNDGATGPSGAAGPNGAPGQPGKMGEALLPPGATHEKFRIIRE